MSVALVRELLAEHRQAGLRFEDAWPRALCALPPEQRAEWMEALQATIAAWEAAYHHVPAGRPQRALSAIGDDPERDVPIGGPNPWERICDSCGGAIPASRRRTARYCSHRCQRAAHQRAA